VRASLGATLKEGDMDFGDLLDVDGDLGNVVPANSVADGHDDFNNDINALLDDDSHSAAVDGDLLNKSESGLDVSNDLLKDWAAALVTVQLANMNLDGLVEADDDILEVVVAVARVPWPATTAFQMVSHLSGDIRQQRADGETILFDKRRGRGVKTERDEKEEGENTAGEHDCGGSIGRSGGRLEI